jgi:hypothetical protein
MGPGGCVAPPHFRKLCTLHVCSINSLGFDPKDPRFTREYFILREQIEQLEAADYMKEATCQTTD